jgi:L-threonylcarbamoyladenylate synthase
MNILQASDRESAAHAAHLLLRGGLVAYPTDTTYALGVNALDQRAVRRLIELKGRDGNKPISIAVPDLRVAETIVYVSDLARQVMSSLMPGALTIILPAKAAFLKPIANDEGYVGVRIPDNLFCAEFLLTAGVPVTATSANPSGVDAALCYEDFSAFGSSFMSGVDLLIDGGRTSHLAPSTVVKVDGENIELVREGVISFINVLDAAGQKKTVG